MKNVLDFMSENPGMTTIILGFILLLVATIVGN